MPTTLHGKVAIIRHFALPTLTYALQALPCPESVQDRVQEITWRFMWGKRKKAQVNRETCELARSVGGLGLPNFKEICRKTHSKCIQRVVDTRRVEPRPVWTALPEHHLHTPNAEWSHDPMAVHTKSKTPAKQIFWRGPSGALAEITDTQAEPPHRLHNPTLRQQPDCEKRWNHQGAQMGGSRDHPSGRYCLTDLRSSRSGRKKKLKKIEKNVRPLKKGFQALGRTCQA